MAKTVVNKSTDYTILPEECAGNNIFTNQGAAGPVRFSLPDPQPGYEVNIANQSNSLPINLNSNGNINWQGRNQFLDTTNGVEINLVYENGMWRGTTVLIPQTLFVPTAQSYNIAFSNVTQTAMTVTFTKGNGANTLALMEQTTTINDITETPSNESSYSASSVFVSGSLIGNARVVYIGTGTSFSVSNLIADRRYFVRLFSFNTDSIYGPQYNTSTTDTYVIRSRLTLA